MQFLICLVWFCTLVLSSNAEKNYNDVDQLMKLLEEQNKKMEKITSEMSAMKEKSEFEIRKLTGRIKELEENEKLEKLTVRSDDGLAWQPVVSQMASQVSSVEAQLQALQNSIHQQVQTLSTGTSYVRWGKSACPGSAELVYTGDVGGSYYNYAGSAVDYLCLPQNPVFDDHPIPGLLPGNNHQQLFGAEYEPLDSTHNLVPVCAVCRTSRSSTVMVPATNACPAGWTVEYTGYLMSGSISHPAATQFICVDKSEDYQLGSNHDDNGKLLYYTVTECGSLACPPYISNKIVQCVVCSK